MNPNKLIIAINGKAQTGKDTICDFIINNYRAEKKSSITPILKIARDNGWDGVKDTKSRKFLSDLKRAFIDFNNLPNKYLIEECGKFLKSDNDIMFVHIRENDQITDFLANVKDSCQYCTLLVNNAKDDKPVMWGNVSDDYADNYLYDYIYYNAMKPLEEAERDFLEFFQKILQEKNITLEKKQGTTSR
jgi:hypothetical protein